MVARLTPDQRIGKNAFLENVKRELARKKSTWREKIRVHGKKNFMPGKVMPSAGWIGLGRIVVFTFFCCQYLPDSTIP
jgi:hypothetical protein